MSNKVHKEKGGKSRRCQITTDAVSYYRKRGINLAGVYIYVTSGQMRKLRNFTTHDDEQQFVGRKIGKTNTLLNKL